MLVACVLIKDFQFQIEKQRTPHLKDRQVLIVLNAGGKRVVSGASPNVQLAANTPLTEAQGRYPRALLIEADLPGYVRRFDEILECLEQVSPVVEPSDPGCAYVGLDGLASMYGGSVGLLEALKGAVPAHYEPRFGISSGKFPATIAAIKADPNDVQLAFGDLREYLAPHPVQILPIPWEVQSRLKMLGLRTLGDLTRQDVGPMQAQFGPLGRQLWEMAQGIDRRPLVPRSKEPQYTESLTFAASTVTLEPILLAIERLLNRLFLLKELRGRYIRAALLQATISRRSPWYQKLAFKEPAGNVRQAMPAFQRLLRIHPPPGPLEDLAITLTGITGEGGRQGSLFTEVRRQDQLKETLAQLEVRLGKGPHLYQYREVEPWSRIPERRAVLTEYVP